MDVDPVAFNVESNSQKRVEGNGEKKNLKRTASTDKGFVYTILSSNELTLFLLITEFLTIKATVTPLDEYTVPFRSISQSCVTW